MNRVKELELKVSELETRLAENSGATLGFTSLNIGVNQVLQTSIEREVFKTVSATNTKVAISCVVLVENSVETDEIELRLKSGDVELCSAVIGVGAGERQVSINGVVDIAKNTQCTVVLQIIPKNGTSSCVVKNISVMLYGNIANEVSSLYGANLNTSEHNGTVVVGLSIAGSCYKYINYFGELPTSISDFTSYANGTNIASAVLSSGEIMLFRLSETGELYATTETLGLAGERIVDKNVQSVSIVGLKHLCVVFFVKDGNMHYSIVGEGIITVPKKIEALFGKAIAEVSAVADSLGQIYLIATTAEEVNYLLEIKKSIMCGAESADCVLFSANVTYQGVA